MQVRTGCPPAPQYVLGRDWFRSCPPLAADVEETEMVCPRPCGENLRQAFGFSCPGSSAAHDAYFSQPHVRAVYRSMGP